MRLQPDREAIFPHVGPLIEPYREYCLTVSKRGMAASLETCAYLMWLCHELQPGSVVDYGSGFTSYVLRSYAASQDRPVRVVSVDDNEGWLVKTGTFLGRHGLSQSGLMLLDEWLARDEMFDLAIYDLGGGEVRNEHMLRATQLAGTILYDDAQAPQHHFRMAEVAQECGMVLLDVYRQTLEITCRYAAVATR